jgi:hypothetical protein
MNGQFRDPMLIDVINSLMQENAELRRLLEQARSIAVSLENEVQEITVETGWPRI